MSPASFPVSMVSRVVDAMRATRRARLKKLTGKDVALNDADTLAELRAEALEILNAVFAPCDATIESALKIFQQAGERRCRELGCAPGEEINEDSMVDVVRTGMQALINADLLHVSSPEPSLTNGSSLDEFFEQEWSRQMDLPMGAQ